MLLMIEREQLFACSSFDEKCYAVISTEVRHVQNTIHGNITDRQ